MRARRSGETLEQMSARMEAMAAQQAALEAHVVKISSEKEHLVQQARPCWLCMITIRGAQ